MIGGSSRMARRRSPCGLVLRSKAGRRALGDASESVREDPDHGSARPEHPAAV